MDIREAVRIMPVLQAANPASLAALISCASLKQYKKGGHLFFDRDEAQHIYFLAAGVAALYKLNNRQEKKVLFIYGAGALLNEETLDGLPASIYCELLTNVEILCFEKSKFLYICQQDFNLSKAVMDALSMKIRRLYRQMKNMGHTVRGDKKVAAKLWKLSLDHGIECPRGIMIDFDLTITYLADLLGYKRETVSRQLKLLTAYGLVIIDKNRFIIPDRYKLQMYFDEV